jgi:hypothetical protein
MAMAALWAKIDTSLKSLSRHGAPCPPSCHTTSQAPIVNFHQTDIGVTDSLMVGSLVLTLGSVMASAWQGKPQLLLLARQWANTYLCQVRAEPNGVARHGNVLQNARRDHAREGS